VLQQPAHQCQCQLKVPRRQSVAQLKNDTTARQRDQFADQIDMNGAVLSKKRVELFEFVFDLASLAAGE
jgi:hypothetical protein